MRVPKTGSTSVQKFLIDNIDQNDNVAHSKILLFDLSPKIIPKEANAHMNIQQAIEYGVLEQEHFDTFDMYGIIRNPIDRFVSQVYHDEHQDSIKTSIDKNKAIEKLLKNIDFTDNDRQPQHFWLTHNNQLINNVFLYENINEMTNKMLGVEKEITHKHRSGKRFDRNLDDIDVGLKEEITKLYAKDFEIYNKVCNES